MYYNVTKAAASTFPIIEVEFEDGKQGAFDFGPYLHLPVFEKLNDPAFFSLAHAEHGTVAWPFDIDFAPERIYEECTPLTVPV